MHLDVFETLADPTRRRIVEALRDGEQQVNDIVRQAGIHQSGVSRHLRILHDTGFVSVRPAGNAGSTRSGRSPFASSRRGSRATGSCGRPASTASAPRSRNDARAAAPPERSHIDE